MKTKDYIQIAILLILITAGALFSGFFGGFVSGACSAVLLFVTVGKIAYRKAQKRVDASLALHRRMNNLDK